MDKEIKNVNLSFCCREDWDSFSSIDDKTRFCGSCKHKVVDFTNASEAEFSQLVNSGQRICGRFKRSQMSESFLKLAAASIVGAASALSISCNNEHIAPQVYEESSQEIITVGIVMGEPLLPDSVATVDSVAILYSPPIVGDTLDEE